jgi:site-specific DNA-methyltransferase (adenine-specific)
MTSMVSLGDGIDGLLGLTPGSVSLVLSDLPSGETQAEFDRETDLSKLWPAIWQALKPDGWAVLLASSFDFASKVRASQGKRFRRELIWSKSVATGFLNAKKSPLRAHEFILLFNRSNTGTYHPQMIEGASPIHACRRKSHSENYRSLTQATLSRAGATDRYPTSVLEFASVGTSSSDRIHPQQKPVPLLSWLVRTYSNPDDLIVDPYAGSGSAGVAAQIEGRQFYGWDSSPRFGMQGSKT